MFKKGKKSIKLAILGSCSVLLSFGLSVFGCQNHDVESPVGQKQAVDEKQCNCEKDVDKADPKCGCNDDGSDDDRPIVLYGPPPSDGDNQCDCSKPIDKADPKCGCHDDGSDDDRPIVLYGPPPSDDDNQCDCSKPIDKADPKCGCHDDGSDDDRPIVLYGPPPSDGDK